MNTSSTIDCKDLYDNAAVILNGLSNDINKTIQGLSKNVEARGVPKNKVARQVVRELSTREVLSKSRIYEGLGIEYKRKYKKRVVEKTFPQVEIISEESPTPQAILLASSGRSLSGTWKDFNGRPANRSASEEQKIFEALRQENKSLKEKERLKEKETERLKSRIEELERQLGEKTEQESELRRENESLKEKTQPELLRELQEKFYDKPGLMDAKQLDKISEKAGREIETYIRRYNTIIRGAVESGEPVPMGLYIIIMPDMKLVPVRVMIDFDKRRIDTSLWEKKLQPFSI